MTAWEPSFMQARTGRSSASLRDVYGWCSKTDRELSADFFSRYPAGRGVGSLTPFRGILQGPGPLADGACLVQRVAQADLSLEERLSRVLALALPDTKDVAVAVSGGVDCWLLAALCQKLGYRVCGWYLDSGLAGYCEREQMERSADALGIACRSLPVAVSDFVECLAEFTAITQTPVYNLHPVSKWLLAKGLCREGISAVVTGDAADQVMRWEWDCDLLPLTIRCFRAAGVRMVVPFMAADVIASCRQPAPNKQPVRDLARQLGVPAIAKQSARFPPLALPASPRAQLPAAGAFHLTADADQLACLSYTTGLLQQWLKSGSRCAE